MPHLPLPEDPSLEKLRKEAKSLQKAARAGGAQALQCFRELHPRPDEALGRLALADAQLVVARGLGFASWPRLRRHLEVAGPFLWDPAVRSRRASSAADPADELLRLACLVYGDWQPSFVERARLLLAAHPEIPRASLHAAAAVGDVAAARTMLAADPALVSAKGGPLGWEPLLYAAYSRLESPGHSTLEVARLLLEHGADPDAGFLWCGAAPPFTALTGAFGEGEDGNNQPPHPERDALARLLLEAGADPNDGQTLYNRHFNRDDGHLRLLLEYGLGEDHGGPWFARLGERMLSPQRMLVEELWAAATKGFRERVELLLEHGVDPNVPGVRDGRTPWQAAMHSGNRAIAELLERHGARRVELDVTERFAAACVAGDREEARALLGRDPGLFDRLGLAGRAELVSRAVGARQAAGVRLMAGLGFELSTLTRNTPLHDAAWSGDRDLVELLLQLGADPSVREPTYGATPLGWAAHNRQHAVVDVLLPLADVFDALRCDGVERVAELLRADPSRARTADRHGLAPVLHLHPGLERAPELLALLVEHGADLDARDGRGRTALDVALAAGHRELAELLRRHGARSAPG